MSASAEVDTVETFDKNNGLILADDGSEVTHNSFDLKKNSFKEQENGIIVEKESESRLNGVIDDPKSTTNDDTVTYVNGESDAKNSHQVDEAEILNDTLKQKTEEDCSNSSNENLTNHDMDSPEIKSDVNKSESSEENSIPSENLTGSDEKTDCEMKVEENMEKDTQEENMDIDKLDIPSMDKDENNENIPPAISRDDIIPSPMDTTKQEQISEQMVKVMKLKEELRCEEAALALLRKLIDSQRGKPLYKTSSKHQSAIPGLHSKPSQQLASKGSLPPPKQSIHPSSKPVAGNQQPVQKYFIQVGSQLVPAPPPPNPSSGPVYQYANGTTPSSSQSYQPLPPQKPLPPKQTPEQKQNAAKAALRRQLEQTLLQIPPPRPPPADWKAVPNVNSMDFMMLVGLDEVVDMILDIDSKPTLKAALEELPAFNPRVCSQCKVDFSPCWKTCKDTEKKKFVLCERCSLQNVKKELKAEHTSRLKSAFLKALKQEQEIEERIKAGEDVNIGNITSSEKLERPSPQQQIARISSPKSTTQSQMSAGSHSNHTPSPTDVRQHHQPSSGHHHRHSVVQHYPHHTSLVQQLHRQHIQQQQLEMEPSSRHSSRWHPYMTSSSHHHRDHHNVHHRSYVQSSSAESSPHQEYFVVHHPQHAGVRYVNR